MKNCNKYINCFCLTDTEKAMIDFAIKTIIENHVEDDCAYVIKSIDTAIYVAVSNHIDNQAFEEEMEIERLKKEQFAKEEAERYEQEELKRKEDTLKGENLIKNYLKEKEFESTKDNYKF